MKIAEFLDFVGYEGRQLVFHLLSAAPGSPKIGQAWYNTTTGRFEYKGASGVLTPLTSGADLGANSVAVTAITSLAATVQAYRLDQFAVPTADISLNTHKLTNVVDPASPQDAATKNYVDAAIQGFAWKKPVRAATTAAGTLTTSFANGSVIDGVTLVTGNDILVKTQAAPAENGIYTVNATGAPTRRNDADSAAEVLQAAVFVEEGTVNADSAWVCTTNAPITLNTTGLTFVQVGGGTGVSAGNGITLTGSVISVTQDTGISVSGTGVAVDHTKVAFISRTTIGDGSTTAFAITHSLGTKSIGWSVRDKGTDENIIMAPVSTSTSVATFTFGTAPTTNQYEILIWG